MAENNTITSYKGFDKDFKCRDFQFEVGEEYEEQDIAICKKGFHACESPLEVWGYYGPHNSRFAIVEQSGEIQKEDNTSKVCSSKIKIKAELSLKDIIRLGIEWIKEKTSFREDSENSSGYYAKIDSSGKYAVICCAGNNSVARAKVGSWITLSEWAQDGDIWKPVCVKTEYVDGERIKADTFYKLVKGVFEECK